MIKHTPFLEILLVRCPWRLRAPFLQVQPWTVIIIRPDDVFLHGSCCPVLLLAYLSSPPPLPFPRDHPDWISILFGMRWNCPGIFQNRANESLVRKIRRRKKKTHKIGENVHRIMSWSTLKTVSSCRTCLSFSPPQTSPPENHNHNQTLSPSGWRASQLPTT